MGKTKLERKWKDQRRKQREKQQAEREKQSQRKPEFFDQEAVEMRRAGYDG